MNIMTLALIVLAPVLVWRVYLRVKGMMQSQRSIMTRHYIGVLVFGFMAMVALAEVAGKPLQLAVLGLGLAWGIGLAIYALRYKTRFDTLTLFFTPPLRIGMTIAMLFFARVMQIGVDIYIRQGSNQAIPPFTESLITMLAIGLLGGYFGAYSAGLVRWRLALRKQVLRG